MTRIVCFMAVYLATMLTLGCRGRPVLLSELYGEYVASTPGGVDRLELRENGRYLHTLQGPGDAKGAAHADGWQPGSLPSVNRVYLDRFAWAPWFAPAHAPPELIVTWHQPSHWSATVVRRYGKIRLVFSEAGDLYFVKQ